MNNIKKIFVLSFLSLTNLLFSIYDTSKEKIVICGVGKNIANSLPNMINKIETLGKHFNDYRVIIYENNSKDKTPEILHNWAKNNQKVIIFSENLSSQQLNERTKAHALRDQAPNRMGLIAYARNQALKKAMSSEFNDFNFVIMTDMDFKTGWDVEGVLSSFALSIPWDCLLANGTSSNYNYHDRYAYRDERCPLGPELIGEPFWHNFGKFPVRFVPGDPLKKVYSAFGGIGVYRKEALKNCEYSGYVTEEFEQFMFEIVNKMSKDQFQYKLYKNSLNINEEILPIKFIPNCGYDSPVVCEHSILHASMILNGYDKIYVNPQMICRY